jgi:hypothetical protein
MSRLRVLLVLAVLCLAAPAQGRVAHDPCPEAGDFLNGHDVTHVATEELRHRTTHYLACGERFDLEGSRRQAETGQYTHYSAVNCRPHFKVAGTSKFHWHAISAHWDFWSHNGEWVTWTGHGHWTFTHDGHYARGYRPSLYNWGLVWAVRVFVRCDAIG